MTRQSSVLFTGIGGQVVALDTASGTELWRTKLKGSQLVTISHDGDRVFAGVQGELFCLDAANGEVLWHNKLKGLGVGIICFSGSSDSVEAAATAAASSAAATSALLT